MRAAGLAFGLFLILWLPRHLPVNAESPAAMIFINVLWIVGEGLLLLSLASALGVALGSLAEDHSPPLTSIERDHHG